MIISFVKWQTGQTQTVSIYFWQTFVFHQVLDRIKQQNMHVSRVFYKLAVALQLCRCALMGIARTTNKPGDYLEGSRVDKNLLQTICILLCLKSFKMAMVLSSIITQPQLLRGCHVFGSSETFLTTRYFTDSCSCTDGTCCRRR